MWALSGTVALAAFAGCLFLTGPASGEPSRTRKAGQQRGSALATTTAFFDLGFLTAALALGAIAQSLGLTYGFAAAAAVAALAPLLFLPLDRKPREASPQGDIHDHSPR